MRCEYKLGNNIREACQHAFGKHHINILRCLGSSKIDVGVGKVGLRCLGSSKIDVGVGRQGGRRVEEEGVVHRIPHTT